jgi:hypothetical protein
LKDDFDAHGQFPQTRWGRFPQALGAVY